MKRFLSLIVSIAMTAGLYIHALPIDNRVNPNGTPVLVPAVQKYEAQKGKWNFQKGVTISAVAEAQNEATILSEQFQQYFPNVQCARNAKGAVRLTLAKRGVPESPEGYVVNITAKGVEIKSRDVRGLYYGVRTVGNLLRNAVKPELGLCHIEDWPLLTKRGLYMRYRGPQNNLSDILSEIEAMGALKYNYVMMEFGETFPYKNSPFTNAKNPFTLDDVKQIRAAARRNHLEVVPTLQILSHDAWMHAHPLYLKEMAEDPKRTGWSTSSCPLSPLVQEVNMMAINEQIEFFKPKYFHLSMDEISQCPWGVCPRCKGKDTKKLWQDATFFYTNAVLKKGVTPIVYHDMYYVGAIIGGNAILNPLIKNGVNFCNWDYSLNLRTSRFDYFKNAGAQLWCMSYCIQLGNLQILPQEMVRQGVDGIFQSFWGELRNTCKPDAVTGQGLAGFTLGGNYEWNCKSPYYTAITFDPAWETQRLTNPKAVVEAPYGTPFKPLALNTIFNAKLGQNRLFPTSDAALLKKVAKEFGGTAEKLHLATSSDGGYYAALLGGAFEKPTTCLVIPAGSKASYLAFSVMAAAIPNHIGGRNEFATLTLQYEDNTKETISLRYNQNLRCWNWQSGGYGARFITRFNDTREAMVSLTCEQWKNPHPEKLIQRIVFNTTNRYKVPIALLAISLGGEEAAPQAPSDEKAAARVKDWTLLGNQQSVVNSTTPGSIRINNYSNGKLSSARVGLSAGGDEKKMAEGLVAGEPSKPIKKFIGQMSYSIVEDPTSPEKSPVLKISIPALNPEYRNIRPRLVIDFTFKRQENEQEMKSLFFDYRIANDGYQNIEWPAFYLMNSTPFRAAMYGGFMQGRQDNRWHHITCPITSLKNEKNPVDFKTADTVRLSFFMREMKKPFEIYIGNVGLTPLHVEMPNTIRAELIQETPTHQKGEIFYID